VFELRNAEGDPHNEKEKVMASPMWEAIAAIGTASAAVIALIVAILSSRVTKKVEAQQKRMEEKADEQLRLQKVVAEEARAKRAREISPRFVAQNIKGEEDLTFEICNLGAPVNDVKLTFSGSLMVLNRTAHRAKTDEVIPFDLKQYPGSFPVRETLVIEYVDADAKTGRTEFDVSAEIAGMALKRMLLRVSEKKSINQG